MASQWFYQSDGEKVGPVSSQQLKQLADDGRIQTTTLVWREGVGEWVPAQRIKGLFASASESGIALSGILQRSPPASSSHNPESGHPSGGELTSAATPNSTPVAPTAPSQWYYQANGEKLGPVTSQQLRQLADDGRLQPTTLVHREGMSGWVKAQQVKGLFSDDLENHAAALSGIGQRTPPPLPHAHHAPQAGGSQAQETAADAQHGVKQPHRPASSPSPKTPAVQTGNSEDDERTPFWIWAVVAAGVCF